MDSGVSTLWPFETGEAPFRVKGIAYAFHMEYVEMELPGGAAAQREQLEDSALRTFFEQPFFESSWYDVYPLVQAGHACARASNVGFEEFVRVRGRHQVERDLGIIRRALLGVLSPASLAVRVPRLNASYFDFVEADSQPVGKDAVVGHCHGLPGPVVRWYQLVTETFLEEVISRSGARRRSVTWEPPTLCGHAHGIPLYAVSYEVSWTKR